MGEKQLTCKDYYGDTIEVGTLVALVSDPTTMATVVAINKVNNKNLVVLENQDIYKENVDPKDYYIYLATRKKIREHTKKWVEEDMKNKKHTYIQYKALGEVQIAKGMVLIPAFSDGGDLKYYYVAKDEKTGGYYLQCFLDVENIDTNVLEITESIEKATECFEVAVRANGIPIFKEDYGIKI